MTFGTLYDAIEGQDWPALFRKLAEAFEIAPWRIPHELALPQLLALDDAREANKPLPELIAEANAIRVKKGLKPYTLVKSDG